MLVHKDREERLRRRNERERATETAVKRGKLSLVGIACETEPGGKP